MTDHSSRSPSPESATPPMSALLAEVEHRLALANESAEAHDGAIDEARWNEERDFWFAVHAALTRLRASLAAATEDTARLDWLERFCFKVISDGDDEWGLVWCDPDDNEHNVEGVPLREAIDEAMADAARSSSPSDAGTTT
jgi:hypothetical protein